ncbi:MAG: hypothetical protein H0X11_03330 [Betaproteobacteria bacterium]|nr:hypothetical protein [Betaproteobacteria bacterium]
MFYTRLFGALAKFEVRYLLVGGLAVNLPRAGSTDTRANDSCIHEHR